jgi:hypothetical protein
VSEPFVGISFHIVMILGILTFIAVIAAVMVLVIYGIMSLVTRRTKSER